MGLEPKMAMGGKVPRGNQEGWGGLGGRRRVGGIFGVFYGGDKAAGLTINQTTNQTAPIGICLGGELRGT